MVRVRISKLYFLHINDTHVPLEQCNATERHIVNNDVVCIKQFGLAHAKMKYISCIDANDDSLRF